MNKNVIYIVGTPIGNLDDITTRAIKILSEVDFIAAEDTRHSQKLLRHFAVLTPLISLHDFNEKQRVDVLLKRIEKGESMALISDAGTPLISDPGYTLIRAAHERGITVSPIPGACAAIAALCASGLPTDRFVFEGFLTTKAKSRQEYLKQLALEPRTLIFYEAPHRIVALVDEMANFFGAARCAALVKELTKTFETIYCGSLVQIKNWLLADDLHQKGEFVLAVKGNPSVRKVLEVDEDAVLAILQAELPLKQAVALTAKITGGNKNALYKRALMECKE
jgi:16S rRNA (cytidine1402-2'-O)-methyltransferase